MTLCKPPVSSVYIGTAFAHLYQHSFSRVMHCKNLGLSISWPADSSQFSCHPRILFLSWSSNSILIFFNCSISLYSHSNLGFSFYPRNLTLSWDSHSTSPNATHCILLFSFYRGDLRILRIEWLPKDRMPIATLG